MAGTDRRRHPARAEQMPVFTSIAGRPRHRTLATLALAVGIMVAVAWILVQGW
jgi:hypothetical protein